MSVTNHLQRTGETRPPSDQQQCKSIPSHEEDTVSKTQPQPAGDLKVGAVPGQHPGSPGSPSPVPSSSL